MGLDLVLDDTRHEALRQFFPMGRATAPGSDIVALNGVENSPSHELWEIIYLRTHYFERFSQSVRSMREAIDSVEAAVVRPKLTALKWDEDGFRFSVTGRPGAMVRLEYSHDLSPTNEMRWIPLEEIELGEEPVEFIDDSDPALDEKGEPIPYRFYRVVVP